MIWIPNLRLKFRQHSVGDNNEWHRIKIANIILKLGDYLWNNFNLIFSFCDAIREIQQYYFPQELNVHSYSECTKDESGFGRSTEKLSDNLCQTSERVMYNIKYYTAKSMIKKKPRGKRQFMIRWLSYRRNLTFGFGEQVI